MADDLYAKLPGHRRFQSPMPASGDLGPATTATPVPSPAETAEPLPTWAVGLCATAAFASVAFTILLYLNNR